MHPPQKFKTLKSVLFWTAFILLVFPVCALFLLIYLILAPYHLLYYSANWGLSKKDFPAVQLYLDYFETLHPTLIAHVRQFLTSAAYHQVQAPHSIRFWPTLTREVDYEGTPFLTIVQKTSYSFTCATGLFFHLEAQGFSRRTLYEFLQREVESKVPQMNEEDKASFRRVMDKVCNHNLAALFMKMKRNGGGHGFTLPDDHEKVVPVRQRAVDWIVEPEGSLIVPMDWSTYHTLRKVTGEFPIWKRVKKDQDLADGSEGRWQFVDLR